jgi:hypothetical protein
MAANTSAGGTPLATSNAKRRSAAWCSDAVAARASAEAREADTAEVYVPAALGPKSPNFSRRSLRRGAIAEDPSHASPTRRDLLT